MDSIFIVDDTDEAQLPDPMNETADYPPDLAQLLRQQQIARLDPNSGTPSSHPRFMRSTIRRRLGVDERHRRQETSGKLPAAGIVQMHNTAEGLDNHSRSAFTIVSPPTSTSSEQWSPGFVNEAEDVEEAESSDHESQNMRLQTDEMADSMEDEDLSIPPKLEPIDEDIDMSSVPEGGAPDAPQSPAPATAKRPRGRPRKHPKTDPDAEVKNAKGRSKTGCITCRRRKKKCDEAKPGCMNCQKNSVMCEGYPEKTIWKSGKEKSLDAQLRRDSVLLNIRLGPIIPGVETDADKMFFKHYIFRLSGLLTAERGNNNAFTDQLLQLAVKDDGLMHSILSLSSKHIDLGSEYGLKLLRDYPTLDARAAEQRSEFHRDKAWATLRFQTDCLMSNSTDAKSKVMNPAIYGQMICLILETLADSDPRGQHRAHLDAYPNMIKDYPPDDPVFLRFIQEFFKYHIAADDLIRYPKRADDSLRHCRELELLSEPADDVAPIASRSSDSAILCGVSNGLSVYMPKITRLRNRIRTNINNGVDIVVDFKLLYAASQIDSSIRSWTPDWPANDPRNLAIMLYKHAMWIYLWRTIYPPHSADWEPNEKIIQAVDGGIEVLAQFQPHEPSQTVILAPAFIIGCAAFEPRQREPIRRAIGAVKEYMRCKNTDSALLVLEEVWRLMDARSEESWDWQQVASRMGLDFLAT